VSSLKSAPVSSAKSPQDALTPDAVRQAEGYTSGEERARDTETAMQKALTAILKFRQPRTANIPSGVMESSKTDLEGRTKERDEARLKYDQVLGSQRKLKVEMDSWLDKLQEVTRLFRRRERIRSLSCRVRLKCASWRQA
jgi:hypothetical protein